MIERESTTLGLSLNQRKSEVICDESDPSISTSLLSLIPDAKTVPPSAATLLGAPVGDLFSISNAISKKTHMLQIMAPRLQYLSAQDALLLLRHALAIPKLLYTLRTAPCFASPALKSYDDELRSILSAVANVRLEEGSPEWTQASLPVKFGGL